MNPVRIHSTIVTIMSFLLLGFSETSAYALYPLIGLYLLLPLYTVLGGWPRTGDRQQTRLLWFLVLPTLAFLTMWLCGRMIWGLFLWLSWGERYLQYANWSSGIFAIIVSAILLVRLATGRVNRPYLRINAWALGLCAGLFGTVYFLEFAEGIDGWTARGAAENQFAHLMEGSEFYPAHLPRRIVDETTPSLAAHNGKAFALYIGDARVHEIRVMPYYRWWWSVGYSRNFPYGEGVSVKEQFQRFQESLKKRGLKKRGRESDWRVK